MILGAYEEDRLGYGSSCQYRRRDETALHVLRQLENQHVVIKIQFSCLFGCCYCLQIIILCRRVRGIIGDVNSLRFLVGREKNPPLDEAGLSTRCLFHLCCALVICSSSHTSEISMLSYGSNP
jgi:hypothetical protein